MAISKGQTRRRREFFLAFPTLNPAPTPCLSLAPTSKPTLNPAPTHLCGEEAEGGAEGEEAEGEEAEGGAEGEEAEGGAEEVTPVTPSRGPNPRSIRCFQRIQFSSRVAQNRIRHFKLTNSSVVLPN